MADEKKQAVTPTQTSEKGQEATPETSPVSKEQMPQETPQQQSAEEVKVQEPKEAQKEAGVEGPAAEPQPEKKPRIERRIEQLEKKKAGIEEVLKKLKGQQTVSKQDIPPEFVGGDEPLIKPEELEEGIDPLELERRVQARVEKAKQEAIRQAVERVQYETTLKEHLADIESAPERYPELNPKSEQYDPDFEEEVTRLYELYNMVYNPLTGQKEFVPAVKISEIYKQVKEKWEKIREKGVSQVAGKIAEQVSSSAVAPSASTHEQEVPLEELKKNLWKNPRAVAEKLARKLKVEE